MGAFAVQQAACLPALVARLLFSEPKSLSATFSCFLSRRTRLFVSDSPALDGALRRTPHPARQPATARLQPRRQPQNAFARSICSADEGCDIGGSPCNGLCAVCR